MDGLSIMDNREKRTGEVTARRSNDNVIDDVCIEREGNARGGCEGENECKLSRKGKVEHGMV